MSRISESCEALALPELGIGGRGRCTSSTLFEWDAVDGLSSWEFWYEGQILFCLVRPVGTFFVDRRTASLLFACEDLV